MTPLVGGQHPRASGFSLDKRYLDFRDRTAEIFRELPQLEPIRHFVFRQLVVMGRGRSPLSQLGARFKELIPRGSSVGPLQPADVLLWIESPRAEHSESLLCVNGELQRLGMTTQLVALNGPADLPPGTHRVHMPLGGRTPLWVSRASQALVEVEPRLEPPKVRRALFEAARGAERISLAVKKILDVVRPRAVLSATSVLAGGATVAVEAKRRSYPALGLQHGIPQVFYTPFPDNVMLTWGEASNEVLKALGTPSYRLEVTGSPRHDTLANIGPGGGFRDQLCRSLGLNSRTTIVFFSNGNDLVRNGDGPRLCARWLGRVAGEYPDINFVVRLHPNETGELYRGMHKIRITKGVPDFQTTLLGADVVASLCSTVLYEALLCEKPVWQFQGTGWPELADNWRTGIAARVKTSEQLGEMVGQATMGDPAGRVVPSAVEHVFANRGRATQAVAKAVLRAAQ